MVYKIKGVRYGDVVKVVNGVRSINKVIEYVHAGRVNGQYMADIRLYHRLEVMGWIAAGSNVFTSLVYVDTNGTERWPTNATVVLTRDGLHITTNPNHTTGDNLENLPLC